MTERANVRKVSPGQSARTAKMMIIGVRQNRSVLLPLLLVAALSTYGL
jgi:hypothetical protein